MVNKKIFFTGFLLLIVCTAYSQQPLFSSDSMLIIKVEGDLHACINDRGDEREYHPITVTHYEGEDSVVLPMKAKVRGNFRRKKSTCQFPPLRFKMEDSVVLGTVFEGQSKIKLVTHCRGKNQAFEQKLFQEYLAYRTYNLLTDQSFRVRLIEITYVNTGRKPYVQVHHGFLIEDDDDMAARLGGTKMETSNVHPMSADGVSANRLALFEYMIGNTDWSIPAAHNMELIMMEPGTAPIVVPYDFDWSGIVGAPYAEPNPLLGISSVKERVYRGFCRPESTWEPVWETFERNKDAVIQLYLDFPYLTKQEKNASIKYIEGFYNIIEDPRKRALNIEDQCRTNR